VGLFKINGMKHLVFIILLVSIVSTSCKQKQQQSGELTSASAVVSEVEEVTAAVSALLPSPHSFQLKQAKKWHDAGGENWLVLYETGSYVQVQPTMKSAHLAAILYQKTDSGFVEKWRLAEEVTNCSEDLSCEFYSNQLSITDLDSNGLAEITMVYLVGCKSDLHAAVKKLVLYEGKEKYTITSMLPSSPQKDTIAVPVVADTAFANAPSVFLNYATDYWKQFGQR
jgi:hypothetical protein